MTQGDLGLAWGDMPAGDKGENVGKSIAAYEAALAVLTKDADPSSWANTQYNLGIALADMADVKSEDSVAWLARAIASDKAALSVFTPDAFPRDHADAEESMDNHRRAYEAAGGPATRPFDDIPPAE